MSVPRDKRGCVAILSVVAGWAWTLFGIRPLEVLGRKCQAGNYVCTCVN